MHTPHGTPMLAKSARARAVCGPQAQPSNTDRAHGPVLSLRGTVNSDTALQCNQYRLSLYRLRISRSGLRLSATHTRWRLAASNSPKRSTCALYYAWGVLLSSLPLGLVRFGRVSPDEQQAILLR